jgi:hypothetical protein
LEWLLKCYVLSDTSCDLQKALETVWSRGEFERETSKHMADHHKRLEDPIERARVYIEYHRWNDSIDELQSVFNKDPDNIQAKFLLEKALASNQFNK